MKLLYAALVGVFCISSIAARAQTVTIEQTSNNGWYSLSNYTDEFMGFTMYQELGQTFTASYPMHLQSLGFRTPFVEKAGNVILEIYSCENMETFTTLLATTIPHPVSTDWTIIPVDYLNITLEQGKVYGYRIKPQAGLNTNIYSNSPKTYGAGRSFAFSNSNTYMLGDDLNFRVTGTIASVAAYAQNQTSGSTLKLENRMEGENTLYSEAGILFEHNTGGTLADLRFHLQSVQQAGSVEVSLYRTSTLLGFEQYITARTIPVSAAGWQQVDLHDLHIPLTTGTNYGVVIRALPGFSGFISTAPNTIATANTYAYSNGYPSGNGSFIYTNADLALVANVFFSLPVQMGPLTARETGGQVWVEWKTLSEQNSRSFAIEHSRDGKSWQEIGRVAAKGQSAGPSAYQFRHSDPAAGKQYYRLAQEDLDGTVTRSEIVALVVGKQVQPLLQLLNNPATVGIIRIQLNAKEPVAAALYDGQGKLLQRRQLQPGFNEWTIPGKGRGVYLLRTPTQTLRVMR